MPIEYHPNPESFLGTGTVFISWVDPWPTNDRGHYTGYWDAAPDLGPAPLEQMPEDLSLQKAVRWGRDRSPRIYVRPEQDPGRYYWAGEGPAEVPDGHEEPPTLKF